MEHVLPTNISCQECVTMVGMVWQSNSCLNSCMIANLTCVSDVQGCEDLEKQEIANSICPSYSQSTCESCLNAHEYCGWNLMNDNCFMSLNHSEEIILDVSGCPSKLKTNQSLFSFSSPTEIVDTEYFS